MQSDIELAIIGLEKNQSEILIKRIPHPYTSEDRTTTGYGLVIRNEELGDERDINLKLQNFFEPLVPLAEIINHCSCIARVAVFNSMITSTTTISPKSLESLRRFNASVELSVYPVDDSAIEQTKKR